jgi:L-alanine-DL-glutamate epimerase-like enolase superfamily enzyme
MSVIERVEARAVRIPVERPVSMANRTFTERDFVLVRAHVQGATGLGFAYLGHTGAPLAAGAVRDLLAPLVVGADPTDVSGIWNRMFRATLLHGRAGLVMRALSAVDIALWELNARMEGVSLSEALGGRKAETVPCYASGGYYADDKTLDDLAAEVSGYLDAGYRAVKIKVGRLSPADDEARIRVCREAVGSDVPLLLDANNAWGSVSEAVEHLRAWERHDPYWIEEPFLPDDLASLIPLARSTPIPIASGEIGSTRWHFRDLMETGAVSFINPDVPVLGGLTEYQRVDEMAASFGVTVCPHWFDTLHVHTVAASEAAHMVEVFPDDEIFNFRRLVDAGPELLDGELKVPTGPGLGTDLDLDATERFALDGWA